MTAGVLLFGSDFGEGLPQLLIEEEGIVAKAARASGRVEDQAGSLPAHLSHMVRIAAVQYRDANVAGRPLRKRGISERGEKMLIVGLIPSEALESLVRCESLGPDSGSAIE